MKILAITNSRIPSLTANSIQAMKVCEAVARLGHELKLIAPAEGPAAAWPELAQHYGLSKEFEVEWRPSVRAARRFDFVWHAQMAVRTFGPDLVYTWLPQSAVVALQYKQKVILEMHADVGGRMGAWWLRRFWKTAGRKRMLVTTSALKSALERSTRLAFPNASVQIAPNGVDIERYEHLPEPEAARHQLNLREGNTAGFTGHFYKGRGMDLLLNLARRLPALNFLWVGGTAGAVSEWRTRLDEEHVSNVTLTGFKPNSELPLYQAAADVLLMPYGSSIASSSGQDIAEVINPMKMFEYMAARRAIITADLPSLHEVLDESCAVFCAPGALEAWTAAVASIMNDRPRRKALAENARQLAERHTWLARAEKALVGMQ